MHTNWFAAVLIIFALNLFCQIMALQIDQMGLNVSEKNFIRAVFSISFYILALICIIGSLFCDFTQKERTYLLYLGFRQVGLFRLGAVLSIPSAVLVIFGLVAFATEVSIFFLPLCIIAGFTAIGVGGLSLLIPQRGLINRPYKAQGSHKHKHFISLQGRHPALAYCFVRRVKKGGVVASFVLSIVVLYLLFRLTAPFIIILSFCKLLCACCLVEFAMVEDADKMRATCRYYSVSLLERTTVMALFTLTIFFIAFLISGLLNRMSICFVELIIIFVFVLTFCFCWAFVLDCSLQRHRATPLWQALFAILPIVPVVPWVLGIRAFIQRSR